jgi:GTP diphosphokinase / guanosine-3',5'-bis(diphosphate) 3'-diphosphatase
MKMLSKAILLASEEFVDTYDKGGHPYILHCLSVMYQMPEHDSELRQIAVLHDIVEDTPYTIEQLSDIGFSERVTIAIDLLTHRRGEPYMNYIKNMAKNRDAVAVKMADLRHNSNITRLVDITDTDIKRLAKYAKAYKFLEEVNSIFVNSADLFLRQSMFPDK